MVDLLVLAIPVATVFISPKMKTAFPLWVEKTVTKVLDNRDVKEIALYRKQKDEKNGVKNKDLDVYINAIREEEKKNS